MVLQLARRVGESSDNAVAERRQLRQRYLLVVFEIEKGRLVTLAVFESAEDDGHSRARGLFLRCLGRLRERAGHRRLTQRHPDRQRHRKAD